MRAISGALINVFEASKIIARCLLETTWDGWGYSYPPGRKSQSINPLALTGSATGNQ